MRPCHGSRTDCVVCKYSILGIDTWYCKLHDKYYRERNTKNGRITVAMHTCNGFERGMNRCDECYHMKPIRGGGGCLECKLHLNTPIKYEGLKCNSFLPKESEVKND